MFFYEKRRFSAFVIVFFIIFSFVGTAGKAHASIISVINICTVSPCGLTNSIGLNEIYFDKTSYAPGQSMALTAVIGSDDVPLTAANVNPVLKWGFDGGAKTGDFFGSYTAQQIRDGVSVTKTFPVPSAPGKHTLEIYFSAGEYTNTTYSVGSFIVADACAPYRFDICLYDPAEIRTSPAYSTLDACNTARIGWVPSDHSGYSACGVCDGVCTAPVATPAALPDLTSGAVSPTTAAAGVATTFSAAISNTNASTGSGFTNLFQKASDASGTGAADIGTAASAALPANGTAAASLSYTFSSAGTQYLRVCADKSSSGNTGAITESNEGNNCGPWTAVTVSNTPFATAPSAKMTGNDCPIQPTQHGCNTTIGWTSSGLSSADVAGCWYVANPGPYNNSQGCIQFANTSTASNSSLTFPATPTGIFARVDGTPTGSTANTEYAHIQVKGVCQGGSMWDGNACACPAGTSLSGNTCVALPPAPGAPTGRWNPSSVTYSSGGTIPTISYFSSGAQSCNIYDWPSGNLLLVDNRTTDSWNIGAPWNTVSWERELICHSGPDGTGTASNPAYFTATVTGSTPVTPNPPDTTTNGPGSGTSGSGSGGPSVSCSGSPSDPFVRQPVTWSASVSGGTGPYTYVWSDPSVPSDSAVSRLYSSPGSQPMSLTVTDGTGENFSVSCGSVNVAPCTATLSVPPDPVDEGDQTPISWNVSGGPLCADSCSGSGASNYSDFANGQTSGSLPQPQSGKPGVVIPPSSSPALSLVCTGGTYGPPAPVTIPVTVIVPTASITANNQTTPARVNSKTPSNTVIRWSSGGHTVSCTGTNFSTNLPSHPSATSGSVTVSTTAQTTYTVTCRNKNGIPATASVLVNILPIYNQF